MKDNACIIGYGMVGKATALTFGIEKYFSRSNSNITLEEASKCRYIFICLPTPVENGRYKLEDMTAIIKQIMSYPRNVDNIIIIRSTVYPGYADYVQGLLNIDNIVSNPEFLSEETWEIDAKRPELIVVGSNHPRYREAIKGLYMGRFKYADIIETDNKTAELIKVSLNAFFATKVVFANEIFDFAKKLGANYEALKKAMGDHPWGSKKHFNVHDKGGRGAGGKCLRKDLEAMSEYTQSSLFHTVHLINKGLLEDSGKK